VVLDSYAALSFLRKEDGHEKVLTLFEKAIEADKKHMIAAPNRT
jgi:PIN domain nuclease of toxin-antitoxin system